VRTLHGGNIPAAITVAANNATLFMFGLSQKVKWFSAQQMLSPRGLTYLCDVKPSGLKPVSSH